MTIKPNSSESKTQNHTIELPFRVGAVIGEFGGRVLRPEPETSTA
jgi:hypothetical protein